MKAMKLIACVVALVMISGGALLAQVLPAAPQSVGTVSGTVRTANGAPASGVRVAAMRADAIGDALRAMVSLTQTDSTGRYRLEDIPPGQYYIAAGRVDLPTYFPGTLDVIRGSVLTISSATPLSDIDFVIQDTSASVPLVRTPFGPRGLNIQPLIPNIQIPNIRIPNPQFQSRGRVVAPTAPVSPTVAPVPLLDQLSTLRTNLRNLAVQSNAAWWTDAALVARLGLTAEQKKKVESVFDQYRQSIVQNTTDLAREEAALARLLDTDPLEPAKIISPQIDRVVQARGDLEKTNSRMTLEMRQALTRAQWVQLQMEIQPSAQFINLQVPLQFRNASPALPGRGNGPAR